MLRAAGTGSAPRLLAASAVAQNLTGTVAETAIATVTIPAGALGLNGGVEIRATFTNTSNANNKTHRIRFGGLAGTVYMANTSTTNITLNDVRIVRNRGAANSQIGFFTSANAPLSVVAGAPVTSAVDTSAAVDIVFTGQLGVGTDTITLERYEVWLLP